MVTRNTWPTVRSHGEAWRVVSAEVVMLTVNMTASCMPLIILSIVKKLPKIIFENTSLIGNLNKK